MFRRPNVLRREQVAYLVRESFSGFHRRKLTTGVTVLIMASALLVLSLFTLVTLNLGVLLEDARRGIDLHLYLHAELADDDRADMQLRLLAIPGVQGADYITREQALAEFRRQLGDDAELLDSLDENPLPASFHITLSAAARTAATVRGIRDQIAPWPEVSDIAYGQAWIEVLERWTLLFRMASLLVGLVVFIAAVFVISNTVKLTVASSSRLIEIMKLVGASNFFIRTPFLCEGMLEGLMGGTLAMAILSGTYMLLRPHIEGLLFFTPWQMAGFVLFCVGLGLVGSYSAMRRYLTLA
jgi:cell division transport system permease protein